MPGRNAVSTRYLRILGRLYPDGRLVLRPSYLVETPSRLLETERRDLVARLYDAGDKLLLEYRLRAEPYELSDDNDKPPVLAVRDRIPFPSNTAVVRFYTGDALLEELRVSDQQPEVRLTWAPVDVISGRQMVSWQGQHRAGLPLQYLLRYSHTNGERWQRIGQRTSEEEQEIDFDVLPGGERCRLAVVATDGVNTTIATSNPFIVPIKPCIAMILSPTDHTTINASDGLLLQGQGFYREEYQPELEELRWASSLDGSLGMGAILFIPQLHPGAHHITLTAGVGRRTGQATMDLVVLK